MNFFRTQLDHQRKLWRIAKFSTIVLIIEEERSGKFHTECNCDLCKNITLYYKTRGLKRFIANQFWGDPRVKAMKELGLWSQ